jgi:tetratricopeptide (TPR) repeat protein
MSYQFSIERTSPSKVSALVVVGLVFLMVAGYLLAACSDRSPDQAAAGEPVPSTPSTATPAVPAGDEKSTLIIAGPVSFGMADSAYRSRRYDDAVALFQAYTEDQPTNAWGFYMLGLSAWKAGEREQAETAFGRALAIDSNHVKSHINLSRVLLEGAKPESALVHIEAAIALDSTSSEPLRLLGRANEGLGKTDDAIAAYQRAIVINDGDVWALNNLGALYIRLDRFEDAIGPLARAVELEDGVATFHNNLGMALELTGRFSAAVDAYRAAVAIEGTYGKAVSNLARAEVVKEDPTVTPVDLAERSKTFQEEITRWRESVVTVQN